MRELNVMSNLKSAIESNDLETIARYLDQESDNGAQDTEGNTLLHHAMRHQAADIAALLLAHGYDSEATNKSGRKALDPSQDDLQLLHRVRQAYHRIEDPAFSGLPDNPANHDIINTMRMEGTVHLPGFVSGELLESIKRDFNSTFRKLQWNKIIRQKKFKHYDTREYWRGKDKTFVHNDMTGVSPAVMELCMDQRLFEIGSYYLKKPVQLMRALGMRYLPKAPAANRQFAWHHDMDDRLFKVMLLLTRVTPDDQYMSYVKGTHTARRKYENFLSNKLHFDRPEDEEKYDIVNCYGEPGDIFLFDPNGMHRGNRSKGRIRDAIFIEYSVDENLGSIWGTGMPESEREKLKALKNPHLEYFLNVPPKWKLPITRSKPTWAHTVPMPQTWIKTEE